MEIQVSKQHEEPHIVQTQTNTSRTQQNAKTSITQQHTQTSVAQ